MICEKHRKSTDLDVLGAEGAARKLRLCCCRVFNRIDSNPSGIFSFAVKYPASLFDSDLHP
jgi:hypothetical protein